MSGLSRLPLTHWASEEARRLLQVPDEDGDLARILGVHELTVTEGKPAVSRVAQRSEGPGFNVWFPLVGEEYHLVVGVPEGASFRPFSWLEPRLSLELAFVGDTLTPEDVTEKLGLVPTKAWRRGEPSPRPGGLRTCHMWGLELLGGDACATLDELLAELRAVLEPRVSAVAHVSARSRAWVSLCYEASVDWLSGLVFDVEVLNLLARCGLGLNLDLYAEGPRWALGSGDDISPGAGS